MEMQIAKNQKKINKGFHGISYGEKTVFNKKKSKNL